MAHFSGMHHLARTFVPLSARHLLQRAQKRVLILGGGPTGLYCADRLRHHFEVTVIDSKEYFEFTPGVLRALADPAHHSRITFDYREVLEKNLGVEFVLGEASRLEASPVAGTGARSSVLVTTPPTPSSPSTSAGRRLRMHFDYCVVAVGVSNSLWKPRGPGEPVQPWVGTPSGAGGSGAGAPSPGAPPAAAPAGSVATAVELDSGERALEGRRRTLRMLHERLAVARGAIIVGAGLVGVELAGELAHFFPRLKVTLVDGAPCLLPQLAEGARDYAAAWLQRQGVKLKLGKPFVPEFVGEDEVVLWCVGTRPRSAGLFVDTSVLRSNGQVRVNRRMQVLRRAGIGRISAAASDSAGGAAVELEPLGQGRIYAVGDAAAVEGVATAQIIFHGEEMAAVAVANIEASEDIHSPLSVGNPRREAEAGQPLLCCTSLGPQDGMFSTQSELVATGALAAMQKQMIEATKVGALKGELLSTLLWMPVH